MTAAKKLKPEVLTASLDEGAALKRVAEFENEVNSILALLPKGHELVLQSEDAYVAACEVLLAIKARQKLLDEEHKGFMLDVKKLVARVDGWFKPAKEKHAEVEQRYKNAVREWNLQLEARAKGLRVTALKLGPKDEAKREQLMRQADDLVAPKVPGISFAGRIEVEVTDFKKLPEKYKMSVANLQAIELALSQGEEDIPGVRVKDARSVTVTPGRATKGAI